MSSHKLGEGDRVVADSKGFITLNSVRRAKVAVIFLIAPLGLVAIALINGFRLDEKINVGFLWLSVIAVGAYAVETYQLRKSAEKQVALQRNLMMNEFLPIIVPTGEGSIKGDKLELGLLNCGKGVAKDVRVLLGRTTIADSLTILNDSVPVTLRADQNLDKLRAATKGGTAQEIKLDVVYKDIYDREMRTTGLKFQLAGAGKRVSYKLSRVGWQYHNTNSAKRRKA